MHTVVSTGDAREHRARGCGSGCRLVYVGRGVGVYVGRGVRCESVRVRVYVGRGVRAYV
jgi:hypothetical protein